MNLTIIATLFRAIAGALANPLIAGDKVAEIAKAAELGAIAIETGATTNAELAAFAEEIKAMAATPRKPTEEEWQSFRDRHAAAHAAIQEDT